MSTRNITSLLYNCMFNMMYTNDLVNDPLFDLSIFLVREIQCFHAFLVF